MGQMLHGTTVSCNDRPMAANREPPPHLISDRIVQASELMNAQEACASLGIGKSTLSRLVARGRLTPLKYQPLIFHSDDIERLKTP